MPVSTPLLKVPEACFLSLDLADDVQPCLSTFEPTFLELLIHAPTTSSRIGGHRWSWEHEANPRSRGVNPCLAAIHPTMCTSSSIAYGDTVKPGPCKVIYHPYIADVCHYQAQNPLVHVLTLATLRVGLNTSAYIKCGSYVPPTVGKGQNTVMYISKVWPRDQVDSWVGFCSELSLYKSARYLRSLQGVIVPRLLGVYATDSGFTFNMEPPHPVFWFEASATMPDVLKAKVISAYSDLHARGVLHGDVALRHILVGGDARITIIDFQESRALVSDDVVGLGSATEAELDLEMRRVRYILDFEDARAYEHSKTRREADRRKRNKGVARDLQRRRKAGTTHGDLQSAPPLLDDVVAPPIHPEELGQWKRSCVVNAKRVVIPGVSEARLCTAISEFVCIVKKLVDGNASWSLSSESTSASRASSSPSSPSHDRPLPVLPTQANATLHSSPTLSGTTASSAVVELHSSLAQDGHSYGLELIAAITTTSGVSSSSAAYPLLETSEHCLAGRGGFVVHDTPIDDIPLTSRAFSIGKPLPVTTKRARDPSDDTLLELEISPSKRPRQAEHGDSTLSPASSSLPQSQPRGETFTE